MEPPAPKPLPARIDACIDRWGLAVTETLETATSFVAWGRQGDQDVVLKVLRWPSDEWRCGAVLDAFGGGGTVRALAWVDGAVLMERLVPGTPLSVLALEGHDGRATDILAGVIARMAPSADVPEGVATATGWGMSFKRYLATGDRQIPRALVEEAAQVYAHLCATQNAPRLLHGDLHHYNVLYDDRRGWVAIDPKGVVAEPPYEVGAALRNPYEQPALFTDPGRIARRVDLFATRLKLDPDRILAWGFAQAVLSALWMLEDGLPVGPDTPVLALAQMLRTLRR